MITKEEISKMSDRIVEIDAIINPLKKERRKLTRQIYYVNYRQAKKGGKKTIKPLSTRERDIAQKYSAGMSLAEIGREYQLSRERVRKIKNKAFEKIEVMRGMGI